LRCIFESAGISWVVEGGTHSRYPSAPPFRWLRLSASLAHLDLINAISQLIKPHPVVVIVHRPVLGPKVAPLEPVYWTEVALLPVAEAEVG